MDSIPTSVEVLPKTLLMRGSCELLVTMLNQQGWTNKRSELVASGNLASVLERHTLDRPIFGGQCTDKGAPINQQEFATFRKDAQLWERQVVEVFPSSREFQTAITCIKHFSDAKSMPGSQFSSDLLNAFRLTE